MKLKLLLLSVLLLPGYTIAQNLIGGSVDEVKQHLFPTSWVLTRETLNKGYKYYLSYISKENDYSQAYYFDENKVCDEYRIVSHIKNVVRFLKDVDSIFIKESKNTWRSKDGDIHVLLILDHEKQLFTLNFITSKSLNSP